MGMLFPLHLLAAHSPQHGYQLIEQKEAVKLLLAFITRLLYIRPLVMELGTVCGRARLLYRT